MVFMISKCVLFALYLSIAHVGSIYAADNKGFGDSPERQRLDRAPEAVKVKERAQTVTKEVKQSQRERDETRGRGYVRERVNKSQLRKEILLQARKELEVAQRLLKQLPPQHPRRADLLLRVLETNMSQSQLLSLEEFDRYEKQWEQWDKQGRRGPEPILQKKGSLDYAREVVKYGRMLINSYPKYLKNDVVYYRLAYALQEINQSNEAVTYFRKILKDYPSSLFVPDSHFQIGEYEFSRQNLKEALKQYTAVLRYKRSPMYPWAIYKIAWCYFNMQSYRQSLAFFKRVVSESKTIPGLSPAGREQIRSQALRDMVNVYAELEDYQEAERYFSTEGGEKYYGELLMKLARILRERSQYAKSVAVLKIFVMRNPFKFDSASVQIEAVDTAMLAEQPDLVWKEIQFLLENFGPESAWAKKNKEEPEYPELARKIELVALNYAQREHQAAQRNPRRGYEGAIRGYILYLKYYPRSKDSETIFFYLGEIYYQQNDYPKALDVFFKIVQKPQRGPYFERAWEYLLSASYLPIQGEMKKLRQKSVTLGGDPIPIAPSFQNYLQVCNRYMVTFPKGNPKLQDPEKDFRACVVDTTEIYLKHNDFSKAIPLLEEIAKRYSHRIEGVKAVEMLLYLNQKNPDKLYAIALEMIKKPGYQKGELGQRLRKIIDSRSFQEAMNLQKQGKYAEAGAAFENIHKKNPRGEDAAVALYNSAINYRNAKNYKKALMNFLGVVGAYPNFKESPNALIAAIQISEEALALEQAVAGVEQFLRRYPKHPRAVEIQKQGCYFATVINQPPVAERLCLNVREPEAFEALFEMYEFLKDQNQLARLVRIAPQFKVPSDQIATYYYRQALIERQRNGQAQYERFLIGLARNLPASSSAPSIRLIQAEAFWYQMVPVWKNYMALKLVANAPDGSDLQRSIENKQARLAQMEPSFLKITNYNVAEWSLAALYALGLAYIDLADQLNNAPLPKGLPPEVQNKLSASFKQLAVPPMKKGEAYLQKALEIATQSGVYTVYARDVKYELLKRSGVPVQNLDWIEAAAYVMSTVADDPSSRAFLNSLGDGR